MLRKLLGAGVLLATLAGCTELEGTTCTNDGDCTGGQVCNAELGRCFTEPEVTECTLNCATYEACTATGCKPRFTGLTIQSPVNNALLTGGTVEVKAQLHVDPAYAATTTYPETISFVPTRQDGGPVGSVTTGTRDGTGDTYTAQWTLPTGQGTITLTASYPAASVQSLPVMVRLDTQAPTFTITFSALPNRSSGVTADQADERDPAFGAAFRRDDSVTVLVSADEPVSDAVLTVIGIGAGGNPGREEPSVALATSTACSGGPVYCGSAVVDLSVPEMSDIRGAMGFRVEGKDTAGNQGTATQTLRVTRWKWAFEADGSIVSTPAIGAQGTIYFGTTLTIGTGKAFAVSPEGKKNWAVQIGDVVGSPAVGAFASGEEAVYIAGKASTSSVLYALSSNGGAEKAHCAPSGTGVFQGAIAVGATQVSAASQETGVGVYNIGGQARFVGIRPYVAQTDWCDEVSGGSIPVAFAGSALVWKGNNIYYATPTPSVTSYDFVAGSNQPRTGWPQPTSHQARNFALVDETLYGGAGSSDNPPLGDLFKISTSGGSVSLVYPTAATERVFNLAVGAGNVAYFGGEAGSTNELLSLPLDTGGPPSANAQGVGTLRASPVVARNDRLYTLNTLGRVTAWAASTLAPLWNVNLELDLGAVEISPALDCRRDPSGQGMTDRPLGTLYIGGTNKLYALIVDSPGLAPNAPWPKFQRDARNTGNPASSVTNCP